MAIELIEDLKTIRTYPRLMQHKKSRYIAMALHDHVGGIVWLDGPGAGKLNVGSDVAWDDFSDHPGSVTLWNKD